MFSQRSPRRVSVGDSKDDAVKKSRTSDSKKRSERGSSKKITFENLLSFLNEKGDASFTATSVSDMVEDIYTWSCVDGDVPIRLPCARGEAVSKMIPEGCVMDTRRSSKQVVRRDSEQLDKNVKVDTASIVSSSNAGDASSMNAITRGFSNFRVDPGVQHHQSFEQRMGSPNAYSYGPASFAPNSYNNNRTPSKFHYGAGHDGMEQTDEEEVYRPQRISVSRLHNSQPFARVPESPFEDPVVPQKRTRMVKVKKPVVQTEE